MTAANNEHFNMKAASWDVKPERARLSENVAEYIRDKVRLDRDVTRVLDFGCGTGQVSMLLRRYVRSITAVDCAEAMVEGLEQKIAGAGILNITPKVMDIMHEIHLLERGGYDLIISQMALHHIEDVAGVLTQLKKLLAPGGQICLTDLEKEDGSFHERDLFIPHYGFERSEFAQMLEKLGFFSVQFYTPFVITKTVDGGQVRDFPLFMAIADNFAPVRGEIC